MAKRYRAIYYKRIVRNIPRSVLVRYQYLKVIQVMRLTKKNSQTNVAVIIHLFYIDTWEVLKLALLRITEFHFDLFVSLTQANYDFADKITEDFPDAVIVRVPNRGRDVLPFMNIVKELDRLGYLYVLKLHSKKSTHRVDGHQWLKTMVDNLLPQKKELQLKLIDKLNYQNTGIIGPSGQYLPLSVNFEANGVDIVKVLSSATSFDQAIYVQENRSVFGFFAGTMFWCRIDAIRPVFKMPFFVESFDNESGQIDGTFAHALERVFCILVELSNKKIYEISQNEIKSIAYDSGIIPDWTNVTIKN